MAANSDKLGALHAMLAECMMNELRWYSEQDPPMPVPAATMAAVAKFLKDNNITCDPTDVGDIEALREQFQAQLKTKRKLHNAVELAADDIEALYH